MRILIIDDDETFCRLLVEILEEMGMRAVWTTNGLTGYEMLTRDDYDLCIIDVRMPLVLGTDLAEAIREDYPQVKIILASGFADETLQEYAKRKGILLLSKPFTADRLLDTVELALGESIGRNNI
jgi:two-component system cell cycle sensor histidine kinase/response regulator CckA